MVYELNLTINFYYIILFALMAFFIISSAIDYEKNKKHSLKSIIYSFLGYLCAYSLATYFVTGKFPFTN